MCVLPLDLLDLCVVDCLRSVRFPRCLGCVVFVIVCYLCVFVGLLCVLAFVFVFPVMCLCVSFRCCVFLNVFVTKQKQQPTSKTKQTPNMYTK